MNGVRCGCWVFAWLAAALTANPVAAGPPNGYNLIAIVTDDQGHWAVGANGNKDVKTPNMDKLAKQGARFINAFTATPVCSPSRASYFTGKWGTQVAITDWINPQEGT